jgi:hypothetical protein
MAHCVNSTRTQTKLRATVHKRRALPAPRAAIQSWPEPKEILPVWGPWNEIDDGFICVTRGSAVPMVDEVVDAGRRVGGGRRARKPLTAPLWLVQPASNAGTPMEQAALGSGKHRRRAFVLEDGVGAQASSISTHNNCTRHGLTDENSVPALQPALTATSAADSPRL